MIIYTRIIALIGLLLGIASVAALAADGPEQPPVIAETQLTLRLDPMQGRATVIDIAEETLTVLTAAHFLGPEDVGRTIRIEKSVWLRGRLLAVTRNPGFRPIRSRQTNEPTPFATLGVDSAIATIKVDLQGNAARRMFRTIRAVELVRDPILSNSGQIISVHIIDQFGKEHVLRASNHRNPRCLVWGRQSYDTQRGDSGAGVFYVRKTADGAGQPILIGNVSQTDERGAIASLAYGSERWVKAALTAFPAESR
jgi:hypothetical protein